MIPKTSDLRVGQLGTERLDGAVRQRRLAEDERRRSVLTDQLAVEDRQRRPVLGKHTPAHGLEEERMNFGGSPSD